MLEPTPDILAELGERRRPGQFLVGFAAETDDVEDAGRDKLRARAWICSSPTPWAGTGTGFGTETNEAAILVADGRGRADATLDEGGARRGALDRRDRASAAFLTARRATRR